jgi:hypothetical protein
VIAHFELERVALKQLHLDIGADCIGEQLLKFKHMSVDFNFNLKNGLCFETNLQAAHESEIFFYNNNLFSARLNATASQSAWSRSNLDVWLY